MKDYTYETLSAHVTRIVDKTGVCCYLVSGERRACLLDTCSGIGNIREIVEQITKLPVFVILTHAHLDHMGGAALFDEVYLHPADLPVFQKHGDMTFRIQDTIEHSPCEIQAEELIPTYTGVLLPIYDTQLFDLGGVQIKMIAVKGHTLGMMCPLIVEERSIIFGDACGVSVLLFDEYSSCVSEYRQSLLHLKQYEQAYDTIYRNHGSFTSSKILLNHVIDCCDDILRGEDDQEPVDFHGQRLYAARKIKGHGRADGEEGNILYALEKAK